MRWCSPTSKGSLSPPSPSRHGISSAASGASLPTPPPPHGTLTWAPPHLPDPDMGKPHLHEGFDQIRSNPMAHLRHAATEFNLAVPPQPDDPDDEDAPLVQGHPLPPVHRRPPRSTHPPRMDSSATPPPPPPAPTTRSSRARSFAARAEEKRRRFSVRLSREEIDEDFYALTGRRAAGRPKRRPPAVRKHVNVLFPGLALSEVTAASYEVTPPRVRSRGGAKCVQSDIRKVRSDYLKRKLAS